MPTCIDLEDSPGDPGGDYVLCVTEYAQGDYDGSGFALVLMPDGTVDLYGLGHCSCNGPWDDFDIPSGACQRWLSLEELRQSVSSAPSYLEQRFLEEASKLQEQA